MRQLKLVTRHVGKRTTDIDVLFLKDGEWHQLQEGFSIPNGPEPIPAGSVAVLFPDEWDRQE